MTDQTAAERLARVHEWVTSEVVTAQTEFGNGYRAAQRDIRDLIKGRFDQDAANELRRMADETQQPQQPETEAPGCGCLSEDAVEHQFGGEDCDCVPFTKQRGAPRYCQPGDTVDMISGWEIGSTCPHHRYSIEPKPAAVQQPKEARP